MTALQEQDLRLAAIAERLQSANRDLCRETMPLTGMLLHSADQYGETPPDWFADGEVAAMDLLPGSPAAEAGVLPNDAIVAVEGKPVATLHEAGDQPFRNEVFWAIAGDEGDLHLTLRRDGVNREVVLSAPSGCRALVEVLAEDGTAARSDGRVIQISFGLATSLTDDELANTFAHELAHVVLQHRIRLEAAGVKKGFFGEMGRNRRLNREVEIEADRMSVHLLHNAGYDPAIAATFWISGAKGIFPGGIFRSRIYPSNRRRGEILQEEIDRYLAGIDGPSVPAHLLDLRDQPFAED